MSEVENGPVEDWELDFSASSETTTKNFVEKYISPYLKTINKVQMKTSGTPYDYFYYTRDGQVVNSGGHTHYSIAFANGTYLHFNANYGVSNNIELRIDINGMKKPNMIGRDTFYAYVYPKVEVQGTGKTREELKNLCYKSNSYDQKYCSGLIQADGWEIKNDYPW